MDFGSMSRQNLKDLLDLVDRLGLVVKLKKNTPGERGQMDKNKYIRNNLCHLELKRTFAKAIEVQCVFFSMNLSAFEMP